MRRRAALRLAGALLALAAPLAATTCSSGGGGDASCACRNDSDCGQDARCDACTCRPVSACTNDEQCGAGALCDLLTARCRAAPCTAPEDCPGGTVCSNGECIAVPDAEQVESCRIASVVRPIREGQRLQLDAVAFNRSGARLPGQSFDWSSSNPEVVTVEPDGVALGGPTSGVSNVTARLRGAAVTCESAVTLRNYARVASGMRVVVVDARTGAPLPDSRVVVGAAAAEADENGAALLERADLPADVTVFHADYDYVTVARVTSNDLLFPLPARRDPAVAGGAAGRFTSRGALADGTTDAAYVGLAGLSIAGGLLGLDVDRLAGAPLRTRVRLGTTLDGARDLGLPGGIVLRQVGEPTQAAFRCEGEPGRHVLWGLGGWLPLERVEARLRDVLAPPPAGAGGTDGGAAAQTTDGGALVGAPDAGPQPDAGATLAERLSTPALLLALLPLFAELGHGAQGGVDLRPIPRVADAMDLDRDGSTTNLIADYDQFPAVELDPARPLHLRLITRVPRLPEVAAGGEGAAPAGAAARTRGVVALVGADSVEFGLVPLGLTAAMDRSGPAGGGAPDGGSGGSGGGSAGDGGASGGGPDGGDAGTASASAALRAADAGSAADPADGGSVDTPAATSGPDGLVEAAWIPPGATAPAPGDLPLWAAAQYGGVQGNPYVIAALTVDTALPGGALAVTALRPGGSLRGVQILPPFPEFPANVRLVRSAAARRLELPVPGGAPAPGGAAAAAARANAFRAELTTPAGARWIVYAPAEAGHVPLPAPPAGFDDRAAAPSTLRVQALRLADAAERTSLAAFEGPSLAELASRLTGFAARDCAAPDAGAPAGGGGDLTTGCTVVEPVP